jgi:hypothetical protein
MALTLSPSSLFGNLHAGDSVSAMRLLAVAGDAFVAGDLLGRVDIGGTLHVPTNANIASSVAAHDITREPVTVAAPCDCATPALDVNALVMGASSNNNDASIALDPAANPTTLDLPCGAYYLSSLSSGGAVDVAVHGRAALFIGGNVTLGGGMRVTLDNDAALDIVIAGSLRVDSGLVGATEGARVRLWLGGDSVQLGGDAALGLALYAPHATLGDDNGLTATGAIFVDSMALGGDLTVRYDGHLLQAASECGDLPSLPVQ